MNFILKPQKKNLAIKGKTTLNFKKNTFTFWTVPSFHDDVKGVKNGVNGILCFEFNKIKVVHMGDIGHVLEKKQVEAIGEVDILMIPVDSYYIMDLPSARKIVNQLSPSIVIPIHYKTDKSKNKSKKEDLDQFVRTFSHIKKIKMSRWTVNYNNLPTDTHLLLMEYPE